MAAYCCRDSDVYDECDMDLDRAAKIWHAWPDSVAVARFRPVSQKPIDDDGWKYFAGDDDGWRTVIGAIAQTKPVDRAAKRRRGGLGG
ncbi:acyl-CoA synthetase [Sesbania bispinosa]|nr:acyl-CoA synthetase [Sesbania bispinosa]